MPKATSTSRAQEMRRHLNDLDESDLSVREYSELTGVSVSSIYHWRRRLSGSSLAAAPSSDFVSVTVVPGPIAAEPLVIEMAGGRRIMVGAGFDAESLRRLITVVESC